MNEKFNYTEFLTSPQPDSYAGHSFSPLSESAVVKVFGLVKNQKTSITPGYFTPFSISGLSLPS